MPQYNKSVQACLEAWVNCEHLLIDLQQKSISFSNRTLQVINECATMCLSTLSNLNYPTPYINQIAFLCLGVCEECAEVCDKYTGDIAFQNCAQACRQCSSAIAYLAETAV